MTNASQEILALFPGQGSQHVGMAKDLLENFAVAREVFEEASDAVGLNLRKLCLDGPESDLTLTENTQPCLLAASVAAFRVAEVETGFRPTLAAGHSLGEYSALVAIGALELSAAAAWVRARGQAMQRAVPAGEGTMAALLGMEDAAVEELCRRATAEAAGKRAADTEFTIRAIVQPANFNSPGQTVIAGSRDAVDAAVALVKSGTIPGKAMPLNVSAPFHCALMEPARARMAELFGAAVPSARPRPPRCAYLPNRTARATREPGVVFELLVEQVDHPVLWKQSMLEAGRLGVRVAAEFGPGKVLTGLLKRMGLEHPPTSVVNVPDGAGIKALAAAPIGVPR